MPFVPNPDADKIAQTGSLSLGDAVASATRRGIKNREEYVSELQKDEDIRPWPMGPGGVSGYAKHHEMTEDQVRALFTRIKALGGPSKSMAGRDRLAYEQWDSRSAGDAIAKNLIGEHTPRPELDRPYNNRGLARALDVEKALAPPKRAQD